MNTARVFAAAGTAAVSGGSVRPLTGARVAVVVGDTLVRAGVRHLLSQCAPVPAVTDVPPGTSPLAAVQSLRPDVLVLGIGRSVSQQLPVLAQLGRLTRVVALCGSRDVALAARGSVARVLVQGEFSQDDFVRAVMAVASVSVLPVRSVSRPGPAVPQLSVREADVMRCISQGMRNNEIAAALTLTQKTVKNHINRIFAKLGVETRTQALLVWLEAAA